MNLKFLRIPMIGLAITLISAACAPKATSTPVDIMGTAAQLAMVMLTQTVEAYSPTPPPPTETPTPSFTDNPSSHPPKHPRQKGLAHSCSQAVGRDQAPLIL